MTNSIKRFRYIEKDIPEFVTIEKIWCTIEKNRVVKKLLGLNPDCFGYIRSLSEKNGNVLL